MHEKINKIVSVWVPGLDWSKIFPAGLQFNNLGRHLVKISSALILCIAMFPVMHKPAHVYAAGGCSDPNNTSNVCVYLRQMQADGKIASEEKDTFLNILFDDDAPTDAFYNLGYNKGENFKNNILYKISKGLGDEIGGWHDSVSGKDFNIWNCIASFGNSTACDLPASAYYDSGNRNYYVNATGGTTNNTTYQNVVNNNQKTITYYNTNNNTWETNNYNNYYYDMSTHLTYYTSNTFNYVVDNSINYTKVAIYDNSGLREQYNHYFKLPNGDNSLNYTAEDLRGYKLDYYVKNYDRYTLPSDLVELFHFNGDLVDELHPSTRRTEFAQTISFVHSNNDWDSYLQVGGVMPSVGIVPLDSGNGTVSFRFMVDTPAYLWLYNSSSGDDGPSTLITEGAWHQLDLVLNNGVGTLYIDGLRQGIKEVQLLVKTQHTGIKSSVTNNNQTIYQYNYENVSNYVHFANSGDINSHLLNGTTIKFCPPTYWTKTSGSIPMNVYIDEYAVYNTPIYTDNHEVRMQPIDSGIAYTLPVNAQNNDVLIQSLYAVNSFQFGGVRNPDPATGDVYISVNDYGFITSCQQWNGYNWRSVNGSVYDAENDMWVNIIGTSIHDNAIDTNSIDTSVSVADADLSFFERWFNKFDNGITGITEAIKNITFGGGSTTNNIYDSNYVTNNYTEIENNYNSVLVPGNDAQQSFQDTRNEFRQRIGIFGQAKDLLIDTAESVQEAQDNEKIFEWQDISFMDVVIIPAGSFDLKAFVRSNDTFSGLYDIYLLIIDGLIYFGLLRMIYSKLMHILDR